MESLAYMQIMRRFMHVAKYVFLVCQCVGMLWRGYAEICYVSLHSLTHNLNENYANAA